MGFLDSLISDYPGATTLAFAVLWAVMVALWRHLSWFVKREFIKLEDHQDKQDKEILAVQKELEQYRLHFAVSQRSFDELVDKLDKHIDKEADFEEAVTQIREDEAWIKGSIKKNGHS